MLERAATDIRPGSGRTRRGSSNEATALVAAQLDEMTSASQFRRGRRLLEGGVQRGGAGCDASRGDANSARVGSRRTMGYRPVSSVRPSDDGGPIQQTPRGDFSPALSGRS